MKRGATTKAGAATEDAANRSGGGSRGTQGYIPVSTNGDPTIRGKKKADPAKNDWPKDDPTNRGKQIQTRKFNQKIQPFLFCFAACPAMTDRPASTVDELSDHDQCTGGTPGTIQPTR